MSENLPQLAHAAQNELIVAMKAIGIEVTAVGPAPDVMWKTFPSARLQDRVLLFLEAAQETKKMHQEMKTEDLWELVHKFVEQKPPIGSAVVGEWRQSFEKLIYCDVGYLVCQTDKYVTIIKS